MKKIFLALLLLAGYSNIYAQKRDNIWLLGYNYDPSDDLSEGTTFDFGDSLQITYEKRTVPFFDSYASICDSIGNLLLYSNGCYVADADGYIVENSEGMNPGIMYEIFCASNEGYNRGQNMILLQNPENENLFHFFHIPVLGPFFMRDILHTIVDISANNGSGTTVSKNQVLVSDTMHYDGFHAVKHANGRDWWVVAAKQNSNKYYLLLLNPQGVHVSEQYVGVPTISSDRGEIAFSPDGTKMARYNAVDDLRVFDFDRCSGLLYNSIHIEVPDDLVGPLFAGLGWSADSRYLYITDTRSLFQFDVLSSDIASSRILIAEAEPPVCPLSGTIGFMELGPDGILYSRPFNGQKCMHRMKHPERAGTACDLQQNYYQFEYPISNMPHFPNFRLGPIDGSPCDTLGLDNHPLANWRYDRTPGLGVDFTSVSWYNPTDWWWDFGDPGSGAANSSTEKHPSHTYPAAGPYEVCLTVSNQYGSDTKCKTVWVEQTSSTTLSPSGGPGGRDVVVWPNPTTGEVFFSATDVLLVRVFSSIGQLQLENTVNDGRLSLAHLPPGLYRFQIFRDGQAPITRSVVLLNR